MARQLGSMHGQPPVTGKAAGAITRGHGVNYTANVGEVEQADAAGQAIDGIAISTVPVGDEVAILQDGRFEQAVAGAALATVNTDLAMDASGRFVAAVTGDVVVGQNLTPAAGADDQFVVELDRAGTVVPA